jgi:hypothetical protein
METVATSAPTVVTFDGASNGKLNAGALAFVAFGAATVAMEGPAVGAGPDAGEGAGAGAVELETEHVNRKSAFMFAA